MKKEQWKQIIIDDVIYQYEVSTYGRIRNMKKAKRIIKQHDNGKEYLFVRLCKNGKYKNCSVHRLVANAFIPNPHNYSDVNHKDKNRQNNHVDNLEWLPHDEHMIKNKSRKVKCIELNTIFDSIQQASKETGVHEGNIVEVCKGKRKSCGGFTWEYV